MFKKIKKDFQPNNKIVGFALCELAGHFLVSSKFNVFFKTNQFKFFNVNKKSLKEKKISMG
jgi:hypothetical protein